MPFRLPDERNEPNFEYRKGSLEHQKVQQELQRLRAALPVQSHVICEGQVQSTSESLGQVLPGEHGTVFTNYPLASRKQVEHAISSMLAAKKEWEDTPFVDRASVFLKAAELVAGKYRHQLIAATMLGQGKNVWQAEIDAAAELADFFRLHCNYAAEIMSRQPQRGSDGMWTRVEYRPLEGFVYAVSPFNFTALGGSLVSAPALMGNVVLWKPSQYNVYASMLVYQILLEAGLPPGVIQFVPGDAAKVTETVLSHRDFAGLNFVGSSDVFRKIYARIGEGIVNKTYREFPRVIGETSGKNFHLLHPPPIYPVPSTIQFVAHSNIRDKSVALLQGSTYLNLAPMSVAAITMGSPDGDLGAFMGPVIQKDSFNKIKSIIDASKNDSSVELVAGGTYDGSVGYYVYPTVYRVSSPDHNLMNQEIFGPVLAVYVYEDSE
ncbi:Delta-1-pyrroline-5-carboxylate dehydrogenase, mitochondrial [Beauveria bassiana]|uniref:Delta-1-pyrroline-5-carboxylate dehydrogenase, mitochondrial n=1 Tax=Beauveria bassiana TaxID=176275 RepID=A0A2N6NYD3_BEABA|nr:Delta-1-pyrroline-5-carboxylate dehydrogenase, mitochondrial [Beauveria bassiana]